MSNDSSIDKNFLDLGMDKQFSEQAKQLGIFTMDDMLKANLAELNRNKAFSYLWYTDMLNLLKKHGLLSLFQEKNI